MKMFKWWWSMMVLLLAMSANALHNEDLRWTLQEPPNADGFRIYWSLPNSPFVPVDVGRVPVNDLNQFFTSLSVPDSDIYFYVVAYNEGGDSLGSNQICRRGGLPCSLAPPVDGPPPYPLHAEVEGFALWDANTDTMKMSNFVTGQSFDPGCYAIEIQVNQYLQDNKGSIRKLLDGQPPSQSSCENEYPFAWENGDKVGVFDCTGSLNNIGRHTLTVTPYDQPKCSGTPGTPVSVEFGVGVVPEPTAPVSLSVGVLFLLYLVRRRRWMRKRYTRI